MIDNINSKGFQLRKAQNKTYVGNAQTMGP